MAGVTAMGPQNVRIDLATVNERADEIMQMSTGEVVANSTNPRLQALWQMVQQTRADALQNLEALRAEQNLRDSVASERICSEKSTTWQR